MSDATGEPVYDAEHFEAIADADQRHFWFVSRNRCIGQAASRFGRTLEVNRVLEVGCGTGAVLPELSKQFPGAQVVGLELFKEGLAKARRHHGGGLVQADMFRLPFGPQFDVVGAFDVIEHVDDDVGALVAMRGVLRPGGLLLVTVPAYMVLWSYFDEVARHRRRYTPGGLTAAMKAAGFEVSYSSACFMALFPIVWVKRLLIDESMLSRRGSNRDEVSLIDSDLRVRPLVNWILTLLLKVDCLVVRLGWSFPIGTSVIAVARVPRAGASP